MQKSDFFFWPGKSFSVHGMADKSCHSPAKLKQGKPSNFTSNHS